MKRILLWASGVIALLLFGVSLAAWLTTYHPGDKEPEAVTCTGDAPLLRPGQKLKVLNWNVQYMAGKNYVFFYDLMDGEGPDDRPTREDIETTLEGVARVIRDENPDLILLQEIEQGAKRTDYEDQIARLLEKIGPDYRCHASTFYWKAWYVPHPRVQGSVGMKLATLSRYKLGSALRHQLPEMPADFVTRLFYLKRAVLETRLPIAGSDRELVALNTHLDAFAQGSDTMQRQVALVTGLLDELTRAGKSWLIGGDFNLLPPNALAYERLKDHERAAYLPETELRALYDRYPVVPGRAETEGPDAATWFTHFPNDPRVGEPDRTIDYIFFSPDLTLGARHVRQHDTRTLSDHFPIVTELELGK